MEKFEETGSVNDMSHIRYQNTARSMENIAAACCGVKENSNVSIPRGSQKLVLSYSFKLLLILGRNIFHLTGLIFY